MNPLEGLPVDAENGVSPVTRGEDDVDQQLIPLTKGMDVYGAEGDKVGSIQDVQDDYVLVEKGFFFPKDYYIPWSAIQGVTEDNEVYLTISKDEALNQQWDTLPQGDAIGTNYTGTTTGTDYAGATPGDYATGATTTDGTSTTISSDYTADTTGVDTGAATTGDTTRVPVYEEQVTPVKRPVSRGAVRIEKVLVTENRTVEVPVTEERVRVTRVNTDEPVSGDATGLFEEGVVEVPLTGEEVSLEKTARKTGEVVVEKERDAHTEQVAGTVRREDVRVDDETVTGTTDDARRRS
jgi:uncharacterized protein (TIGR02271 family)